MKATRIKATVTVTSGESARWFKNKLPTFRNGFCDIERSITLMDDPDGIYPTDDYGYIKAGDKKLLVFKSGYGDWVILREMKALGEKQEMQPSH